jgi:hypothetical protein
MFTPPAKPWTPWLPPANTATVASITSTVAGVDQYQVTPTDSPPSAPFVESVTTGTPLPQVVALATANIAFNKFKLATLTASDRLNPLQLQAALAWFLQNIGRPDYGVN